MDVTITANLTIKEVDSGVFSAGKAECIDCLKLLLTEALRQYGYPADVGELSVKYVE